MSLQTELQDLWDTYLTAYRNKDAQGCASVFTPNAVLMSPFGPTVKGQEEIQRVHEDWTEEGGENKQLKVVEFGGSENLAWCLAEFSEGTTGHGTSLNVIERQEDGAWLIRMCSLNE